MSGISTFLSVICLLINGATTTAALVIAPGCALEHDLIRVRENHQYVTGLVDYVWSEHTSDTAKREALVALGNTFFYGNATCEIVSNGTLALSFYSKAAELGDPTAQFHVGVAHSYGFWGKKRDETLAMLNYYFASLGENTAAIIALGNKHLYGVGAPKNCESALRYYEVAANKAIELREANLKVPKLQDVNHRRLKTIAETQHKKNLPSDAEVVDYYHYSSEKGDAEATLNLAFLYYYGVRGLDQDLKQAVTLFHKAYELGASGSATNLGHIYAHGIGVDENNETAFRYLQEASNEGNAAAQNELAYMYLHGKGTKANHDQAMSLFMAAAKAGNSEAFFNLGVLHMKGSGGKDPEYEVAHGYFQVAAHQGHTVSTHKVAHMSMHGIGTARSCKNAVDYMKMVAERGEWDRLISQAYKDYRRKDYEAAFAKYVVMAQQGYEIAQHNAAWMMDNGMGWTSVSAVAPERREQTIGEASVMLYKFAASQGNVDANLKIGDYYYYGKGGLVVDFPKATAHYSLASKRQNAQAMFNLGFMYEHGIGLAQDFYLAKRFYDKASGTHNDAHVPVMLALWKLKAHIFLKNLQRRWDEFTGEIPPSTPASTPAPAFVTPPASSVVSSNAMPPAESSPADDYTASSQASSSTSSSSSSSDTPSMSATTLALDWRFLQSENFLMLLLAVALAIVLYIRSERQLRLAGQH